MSSLATRSALTRATRIARSRMVRSRPAADSMFGTRSTAARRGLLEAAHLLRRVDLRHQDDVGPRDAGEVLGAACLQRIDAHRRERARLAPGFEAPADSCARARPQLRRREVLELEDDHVRAGARGGGVRGMVGARNEEPGTRSGAARRARAAGRRGAASRSRVVHERRARPSRSCARRGRLVFSIDLLAVAARVQRSTCAWRACVARLAVDLALAELGFLARAGPRQAAAARPRSAGWAGCRPPCSPRPACRCTADHAALARCTCTSAPVAAAPPRSSASSAAPRQPLTAGAAGSRAPSCSPAC